MTVRTGAPRPAQAQLHSHILCSTTVAMYFCRWQIPAATPVEPLSPRFSSIRLLDNVRISKLDDISTATFQALRRCQQPCWGPRDRLQPLSTLFFRDFVRQTAAQCGRSQLTGHVHEHFSDSMTLAMALWACWRSAAALVDLVLARFHPSDSRTVRETATLVDTSTVEFQARRPREHGFRGPGNELHPLTISIPSLLD